MKKTACVIIFVFLVSCNNIVNKEESSVVNPVKLFVARQLYTSIYRYDESSVKRLLKWGDPNFCKGDYGWVDSTPLFAITDTFYKKSTRILTDSYVEPEPDLNIFMLLINAGADFDAMPYIWYRVFNWNNDRLDSSIRSRKQTNLSMNPEDVKEHLLLDVNDANRILRGFLEAGADPDMLGHPYPFSLEAIHAKITDEKAKEYFKKGSRAINVAIEKGIIWESQVDLLLEYTTLDEESLLAAERSKDPEMIEKINKLWDEQNKNNP